jgi:predicted nuclease of predicted toxin-antitoxin system
VRFLIDECISARLASYLQDAGHDAVHVLQEGLGGAPDSEIMAEAARQQRVVISTDTDFGELLAQQSATTPSVLLFRRTRHDPRTLADTLLANLADAAQYLDEGAIVVITKDRMKLRRLPINLD